MKFISKYFPHILLALYVIEFIVLAFNPYDRAVWFIENFTIVPIVTIFIILYLCKVRFSNLAYALMSMLIFMHTYGGHYTFELAPFAWFNDLFGFERNMYDRVAHMTVGLYAYAMIESLIKYKVVNQKWFAYFAAFMVIPAIAAFYEMFEWRYAISADPEAGLAVLGSQGDIWDAQKDMLMDTIGGAIGTGLYFVFGRKKSESGSSS